MRLLGRLQLRTWLPAVFAALLCLMQSAGARAEGFEGYKRSSWLLENGAPSRINDLAQSRDGFLWIGSVEGLFRFDGVTFEPVGRPAAGEGGLVVSQVLGARSGEVWVGLARGGGVSVYRQGRLVDAGMPSPSREVTALAEDAHGGIWVARGGRRRDQLARYWRGRWEELGAEAGLPDQEVWDILVARDGGLWVAMSNVVMRRRPGEAQFRAAPVTVSRRASLAEDHAGRIWLSDTQATRVLRAAPGDPSPSIIRHPEHDEIGGTRVLFDRTGGLWGATWTNGIFRLDAPHVARSGAATRPLARYGATDGLTSEQARAILEDREGNVWIGTELGLDMIRRASVVVEPAIPPNSPRGYRMAATSDGRIHIADSHTLYEIRPGAAPRAVMETSWSPGALCAGRSGALWLSLRETFLRRWPDGRVERFPKPAETGVFGCGEDAQGRLWMGGLERGLYLFESGAWRRWPGMSAAVGVPGNVAVDHAGRAAVLFRAHPQLSAPTPFEPLYQSRFQIGGLEGVLPGRDALMVGGARGLARLSASGVQTLSATQYPWLASVNGLVQTPTGDTWTIGDVGIVRMRSTDLARAFEAPGRALPHQVFDFRDGLNSFVQKSPGPQIAVGGDGRIWALTRRNVVRIDPAALRPNLRPPPVVIRAASIGGRRFIDPASVEARAGATNLSVDYTALSLSAPSRVRFMYRLEGVDEDWVDAGSRRQARYTDLGPGAYRFRVRAANEDGVWNMAGASFDLAIPPTLTQTWPVRAAGVLLVLLLLWAAYALRVRQIARNIQSRLEERAAERERIARELHDTLLQGVQGLIMRFQSVADHIGEGHPARDAIERALDRADQMMVEGRDRVRDLRRREVRRLDVILRELAEEQPFARGTDVHVATEGPPRRVEPLVVDEIVRIAGEALFNAARHARAGKVEVRIGYMSRRLEITVADDGVGIDARRLASSGREGHYGLIGMQERARKLGAQLFIESGLLGGTTIRLSLPAGRAYLSRGDADRGAQTPAG